MAKHKASVTNAHTTLTFPILDLINPSSTRTSTKDVVAPPILIPTHARYPRHHIRADSRIKAVSIRSANSSTIPSYHVNIRTRTNYLHQWRHLRFPQCRTQTRIRILHRTQVQTPIHLPLHPIAHHTKITTHHQTNSNLLLRPLLHPKTIHPLSLPRLHQLHRYHLLPTKHRPPPLST